MRNALTILFIFISFILKQQNCGNIGFELGNSSGWVCKSGGYGTGTAPNYGTILNLTGCINSDGINGPPTAGNRHTIMGPGGGNDPNSINPLVPVVAPGNLFPSGVNVYSFRLGNDAADGTGGTPDLAQAESVKFSFIVDNQNAGFTYLYSAFLQDPNHSAEDQPRFEIKISEVINGVEQPSTCGYYKVIAGGQTATFHTGDNDYRYTDWTRVGLDLTGYIGKTIVIEFITSDCFPSADPGRHSAYVYIDAYCQPMKIDAPILCANTTSAQLCAPPGYFGYTWPAGQPGLSGSPQTQCVTINNPAVGTTYSVNITSVFGCLTSTTVTLKKFGFTVNDTTLCAGITPSFSLCATPTTPGSYTISWAPATGLSCTNCYCPVVTTPLSSPQTYTVTLTDPSVGGCSEIKTVTVRPLCAPTVTTNGRMLCPNECAVLSAAGNGGIPPYSFSWSPGGLSGAGPHTVCPSSGVTYTVTLTDAGGNSFQDTAVITFFNSPLIVASATAICPGGSSTLTASGAQTYTWATGTTPGIGSSVSASPLVTTTYTVTGTSSQGCTNSATAAVTVNSLPTITANNAAICPGASAVLMANGGAGNSYTWIPSCNTIPLTGQSVTVAPLTTCTYTVVGRDANGCINSFASTVTVNPLPVISTTADTICVGKQGSISASGAGTYTWLPSGSTANPFFAAPSQTTTYTVTGTDNNACSNSATAVITVQSIPSITVNNAVVCAGKQATLSASGATYYTWFPQNTTGQSLTHAPSVTTTYTIVGTTAGGCYNSATAVINVELNPVVAFSPDTSGCAPITVQFINNSVGAISSTCYWNYGDGSPVSSQSCMPSHTYTKPGSYTVSLIVITPAGCSDTLTIPNMINVRSQPSASFTISPVETNIMDPKITFTNTSSGDSIRTWTFGDFTGNSSNANRVEYTYKDTGSYQVCLDVANYYGCRDIICQTVFVRPVWSFFIPNAFTPNGDGKNDTFNGKGENIKDYDLYIYDRWGNLVFESNSLFKDWNGIASNGSDIAQEDVYVYLVRFKDIFNKKHQYAGSVTLVR